MRERRRWQRAGRLAMLLAILLNIVPLQSAGLGVETRFGPEVTFAAPAGIPEGAPAGVDLTPAQCTAFFRRWRNGENNDDYLTSCMETMGINRWCADHNSKPYPTSFGSITGDPTGNRRALICVPNPDDDDALAQVVKIASGTAEAFIQAAPYISLASQALACANGAVFACATFALDIADTAGVDLPDVGSDDVRTAVVAAKRVANCADGDVVACSQLGLSSARAAGLEIPGIDPVAIAKFTGGCVDGDIADCIRLGSAATQAAGIPTGLSVPGITAPEYPGEASTIADQAKACADGSVAACAQVGAKGANAVFGLKRPDPKVGEAAAKIDKCSDGDFGACFSIGRSAADALGLNVPPIVKDAEGCASTGARCAELGLAVAKAVDLPAGQIQDQVAKTNQCRQGNTAACTELAKSAGVPLGKIPSGFQNADRCKQQDQAACLALGKAVAASVMSGGITPVGGGPVVEGDPGRPVPKIRTAESGETWIAVTYDPERSEDKYNRYEVNYQLIAGVRGEQGPIKTEIVTQAQGTVTHLNIQGLQPASDYSVSVRGCDFTAVDDGRLLGCSKWSKEEIIRTKTPAAGTIRASEISASPSTATAGSTVKIDGAAFQPGTVEINLTGANGSVRLARAVPERGQFSTTVTIPANTPPGTYQLLATDPNKRQLASTFDITVVAAGGKGVMSVTYDGVAETMIAPDYEYKISGVNIPQGLITIYIDTGGKQKVLTSVTAGADGRFQATFKFKKTDNFELGKHKLTALRDGVVVATLDIVIFHDSGPR